MATWKLKEGFRLQKIEPNDAHLLHSIIVEHAKIEADEDAVKGTVDDYYRALSSNPPAFHGYFIQQYDENTKCSTNIGILMYYFGFSSWMGKKTLFLEDVFISNKFRKTGLGKEIMRVLSMIAKEEDCPRVDWVVHIDNHDARGFYQKQGSKELNQWILSRLEGQSLSYFTENSTQE